jgi:phasin family protein
MANKAIANVFERSQSFLNPVVNTNKLAVAKLEKLVSFQLNALQSYVDLGIDRLKAAAEVSSVQDLPTFFNGQVEAIGTLRQLMLDDAKTLARLASEFQTDFSEQAKGNVQELSDKTAKAAKDTTEKAKGATAKAAEETKETVRKSS